MKRVMLATVAFNSWYSGAKVLTVPFIAFDDVPCEKVRPDAANSLAHTMFKDTINGKTSLMDSSVSYDGKCYYLLNAGPAKHNKCSSKGPLPGATVKTLAANAQALGGIKLDDFVISSVEGKKVNKDSNAYPNALKKGFMVETTKMPGLFNIPVCDYLGARDAPGIRCPKLQKDLRNANGVLYCDSY